LQKGARTVVIGGIAERPAFTNWCDFSHRSFASGTGCIGPRQATEILALLKQGHYDEAEVIRQRFLPFEDLRDSINPIRVLHEGVGAIGVCDTGPLLPLLSALEPADGARVAAAARQLYATE